MCDYLLLGLVLCTRSMYMFSGLLEYWESKGLPIFHLFKASPAFFSQECGEIALSLLTRSRPQNMRCDYEQTRKSWLFSKQRSSASLDASEGLKRPDVKKSFRVIGKFLVYIYSDDCSKNPKNMFERFSDTVVCRWMEQIISGTLRQLPHTSVITADLA